MNKKGDYRLADTGMFFLVFIIVGGFIIFGMYLFYGYSVDVRGEEALILNERIFRSIVDRGEFNNKFYNSDFNIFEEAGLESKVIKNGDFYFRVKVLGPSGEKEISEGNPDYKTVCGLNNKKIRCEDREIVLGDYKINILTASNQEGEKI